MLVCMINTPFIIPKPLVINVEIALINFTKLINNRKTNLVKLKHHRNFESVYLWIPRYRINSKDITCQSEPRSIWVSLGNFQLSLVSRIIVPKICLIFSYSLPYVTAFYLTYCLHCLISWIICLTVVLSYLFKAKIMLIKVLFKNMYILYLDLARTCFIGYYCPYSQYCKLIKYNTDLGTNHLFLELALTSPCKS